VAVRSKAWVCGLSLAGIAVSNTAGEYGCVFVVCVVFCTGRDLCVGLITRLDEPYGA
jgi:hypothetical protein